MFVPFHVEVKTILKSTDWKRMREHVRKLRQITKDTTFMEVQQHKGSWTCDYWTGPNNKTYTVTTIYYIIDDCVMISIMLDFKIYHGSTIVELIYAD